jgi:hypothetical protein
MARRVFFGFDYENDLGRAGQVRKVEAVSEAELTGFFDRAEYEEARRQDNVGIQRLIRKHLEHTAVTLILIGARTSNDPWVRFEIDQSIDQKNGLLGIYIGHLRDADGRTPTQGLKPIVPPGVEFPAYSWDGDAGRLIWEIESAGKRADAMRRRGW